MHTSIITMQQGITTFVSEGAQILESVQLEIAILIVAICFHMAFVGNYRGFMVAMAWTKKETWLGPGKVVSSDDCGETCRARKVSQETRRSGAQLKCSGPVPTEYAGFHERLQLNAAVQKNFQVVWDIVDEMSAGEFQPNHFTCTIIMKNLQQRTRPCDVDRAMKLFDSIDTQVDETLLSTFIDACLRLGRSDLLAPRLQKQRSMGALKKMQIQQLHTYGTIIRAFGSLHDVARVWDTWCEMRARRLVPSSVVLGCMVEALVAGGDTDAGYDLIHEMQADSECSDLVNAVTYGSVLKGYSHQKQIDRVWSVYQEMLDAKSDFTVITYNTLIDACSRSGEMGRISILLEDMHRLGIKPDVISYGAILKGYCQTNRIDKAFELLESMKQTTDYKTDETMYNILIDGCSRQGLYEKGMEVLEQMISEGVKPTNFTLSVLVKLACRGRRVDVAFKLAEQLSREYGFRLNVHVYNNLINGCTLKRDLTRALGVFDEMVAEMVRPDARTYTLLLRGSIQIGDMQEAAKLLRCALGMPGRGLPLSAALRPQGKWKFPAEVVSEVLHAVAGWDKDSGLAATLLQEVRAYMPSLRVDAALQLRCLGHDADGRSRMRGGSC